MTMWKLALAAVLSLPALLVIVVSAPLIALLSIPSALLLLSRKRKASSSKTTAKDTNGKDDDAAAKPRQRRQVIVTGGSSGIGLCIAKFAAANSSDGVDRVIIIARNAERLQAAKQQITAYSAATAGSAKSAAAVTVETISVDVSDAVAVEKAMDGIFKGGEQRTTHLFCCAGEPHPAYYQDVAPATYEHMAQTNQLGSIYVSNAALKHMESGTITLCSSMGGLLGVFGYSAYSPSKFALRGYAECTHMELCNNSNVHIQIAYPPDTDTPGFATENIGKPHETTLISASAGLAKAEAIASTMLAEAMRSHPIFNVYFDFDGFLLCTLTAGFSPVVTLGDALAQLSMTTLTRWIALFYLNDWHRMIQQYQNSKQQQQLQTTKETATAKPGSSGSGSGETKQD
jgi:3-dehydrosphinganine reductase